MNLKTEESLGMRCAYPAHWRQGGEEKRLRKETGRERGRDRETERNAFLR